jgi:hypothetical protein
LVSGGKQYAEPFETLFRIQRGLAGYVSFLATCDANIVFTEYLLYEPTLRILRQMGYEVQCEAPAAGPKSQNGGDSQRLDFLATQGCLTMAIEMKWLRWQTDDPREYLSIERDTNKLIRALVSKQATRSLLCIFGRHTQIRHFQGANAQAQLGKYNEALPPVYADLRRTVFGCRIFELKPDQQPTD